MSTKNDRPKRESAFASATARAKEIKEAIETGENVSNLPVSLIYAPKTHDRKCYSKIEIEELAKSIKKSGLLQPIVVRQVGDKFERLIGFKRLEATKLNKQKEIKAIILKNISNEEAALITISENLFRSDPNVYDQTLAFLDYAVIALGVEKQYIIKLLNSSKASRELSVEEDTDLTLLEKLLHDNLSIKISTFADKIKVLNIDELLIDAIQSRQITYTVALALNSIKNNENLKLALSKTIEDDLSLKEVKKLVSMYVYKDNNIDKTKKTDKLNILSLKNKRKILKLDDKKQKEIYEYIEKINKILKA